MKSSTIGVQAVLPGLLFYCMTAFEEARQDDFRDQNMVSLLL